MCRYLIKPVVVDLSITVGVEQIDARDPSAFCCAANHAKPASIASSISSSVAALTGAHIIEKADSTIIAVKTADIYYLLYSLFILSPPLLWKLFGVISDGIGLLSCRDKIKKFKSDLSNQILRYHESSDRRHV